MNPLSSRSGLARGLTGIALSASLLVAGCAGGALHGRSTATPINPHSAEAIGSADQIYDGTLMPDLAVSTYRNIDRVFPTRTIQRGASMRALPHAPKQLGNVRFSAQGKTYDLYDFLSMNRVAGLLVLKNGQIVSETYQLGNTQDTRWMSMSVAKAVTSTLIGMAVKDGFITSIDDPVTKYVPALAGSAYERASVRNVLMMASGVKWDETYEDANSGRRRLLRAQLAQRPGSMMAVMKELPRATEAGSMMTYSTGETQIAAEIIRGATKKPLATYLSEKLWSKYGMESDATWWLDSPEGVEIGGSGISATLRDYGRLGLFVMDDGFIGREQVLPRGWMAEATTPRRLSTGAVPTNYDYGYLWWIPKSGQSAADKAYMALGAFGQSIYVNPKEKVVIVLLSAQSKASGTGGISITPFFDAVVAAVR